MRSFVRRVGRRGGILEISLAIPRGRKDPPRVSRFVAIERPPESPEQRAPMSVVSDVVVSAVEVVFRRIVSVRIRAIRDSISPIQGCFRDISSQAASLQNCTNVEMRGEMKKRDLARF